MVTYTGPCAKLFTGITLSNLNDHTRGEFQRREVTYARVTQPSQKRGQNLASAKGWRSPLGTRLQQMRRPRLGWGRT